MVEVSFQELMEHAEKEKYAVGYFESWNMDSILAVCDASEKLKSPVIIGFSGLFLTNKKRVVKDPLSFFAKIAKEACESISVPACTIFNESNDFVSVLNSIDHGYKIIMFVDASLTFDNLVEKVSKIVEKAHKKTVAVEAELDKLPGLDSLTGKIHNSNYTVPETAKKFVSLTGIDALSINIGQSHKNKAKVKLDLNRLKIIREAVNIPLVLHGGSNLDTAEIGKTIDLGIRKFNVGRILKQTYLNTLKKEIENIKGDYNLYEIIGSGFKSDVLVKARLEVQRIVENYMHIFRSAGKA